MPNSPRDLAKPSTESRINAVPDSRRAYKLLRMQGEAHFEMFVNLQEDLIDYTKVFDATTGTTSIGYIGDDKQKREASKAERSSIHAEIWENANNAIKRNRGLNDPDYRRQHAEGTIPGNSKSRSIGLVDRARNAGYAAEVVRIALSGNGSKAHHNVTAVALTDKDLQPLREGRFDPGNMEKVLIVDATLGIVSTPNSYPRRVREAAERLDAAGMGVLNAARDAYVSPIESGWADAVGQLPKNISIVDVPKLPEHVRPLREGSRDPSSTSQAHRSDNPPNSRAPHQHSRELVR